MVTWLLRYLLLLLPAFLINCVGVDVFAAEIISDLEKQLRREPVTSQIVYADKLINAKKMANIKVKSSHLKKAEYLYHKAQGVIGGHKFLKSDFVDLVRVVSYIRSKQKKRLIGSSKYTNIYVHPSEGVLRIPVQFYDNKHVYIHLKNFDLGKKFGGYKTFSRSIDFDTGKIFACLVAPIQREKDKTSLLRELSIQLSLSSLSYVLSFRDIGLYQGYRKGALVHKFTFQTELFESDLSLFYSKNVSAAHMARIMLQASKAVSQMHLMGYIHRDIKPANLFIKNTQGNMKLVIADFGLSQSVAMPQFGKHLAGTRGYMDPRISLNHAQKRWACQTVKECELSDIYSLGISFYSLIKGRHNTLKQITNKVNNIALPKDKQNPLPVHWIYRYLKDLDRAYQKALDLTSSNRNSGGVLWSLEKIALSMANPEPKKRPSLSFVIDALERLNADLPAKDD
ncbi:MAG: protein kinase [Oligoflexales bacterium]